MKQTCLSGFNSETWSVFIEFTKIDFMIFTFAEFINSNLVFDRILYGYHYIAVIIYSP